MTTTATTQGTCPVCAQTVDVARGRITRHRTEPVSTYGPTPYICSGTGKAPVQAPAATFKVVRFYFSDDFATEVVSRGLTQEQAQAYCQDPQTSSSTCTDPDAVERTALRGAWFCGWEEERPTQAPAPAKPCNCEHISHETADGHAYMAVPAGERSAQWVGAICDECADSHMASYVLDEPAEDDGPAEGFIRVAISYDRDLGEEFDTPGRSEQTIDLPSWCSGDPASGAALYLFGYAGAVDDLHLTAEVIA